MDEPRPPLDRRDAGLILLLMLLTVAIRLWQMTHTEVLARDSIGFIRMAYEVEQYGWRTAIDGAQQHPGFPLTILAVHRLASPWLGDDLPTAWQLAAQIASSLASVLLVVPVYLLGRRLFDRPIAFASVVLVQCFPALGRLFGDGLSEAVFLLFAASAYWAVFRAFDTKRMVWFVAVGVFSGLAYFVRPEGLLIGLCAGLVLVGRQGLRTTRQAWRPWLAQTAGLAGTGLLVVAVFYGSTGKFTLKPTALQLMGRSVAQGSDSLWPRSSGGGPLLAAWWEGAVDDPSQRIGWAASQLGRMVIRGTFHVGWVFGLLALWWYRDRLGQPGVLVLGLLSVMIALLLYRVAWYLGYLSDRHLALVLLAFAPFIAAGLIETGRRSPRWPTWMPAVLVVALAAPAAYRTLLPLHDDRAGFRQAGEWLAENTLPGDYVVDPFAWTHYYAGRVFVEKRDNVPTTQPPVEYVLLEKGESKHHRLQSLIDPAEEMIRRGRLCQSWDLPRGTLEVWQVPREESRTIPGERGASAP